MWEKINESEFIQRFVLIDRKENFSLEGRKALFEYLENLEEDIGEKIEFDPIAICCEYNEYEDINQFRAEQENYKGKPEDYEGDYKDLESIRDQTTLIEIKGTKRFIIEQF